MNRALTINPRLLELSNELHQFLNQLEDLTAELGNRDQWYKPQSKPRTLVTSPMAGRHQPNQRHGRGEGEAPAALPMEGATRAPLIEAMGMLKERFQQKLQKWQQLVTQTQNLVSSLPKEMRQRDMITKMGMAIDQYQKQIRLFYDSVSQKTASDYRAGLSHKWDQLKIYYSSLKTNADELLVYIKSLQSHPLYERFLEGKQILSSRKQLQWGRKLFHTFNGLFGLWLWGFSGLSVTAVTWILVGFFSTSVLTEVFRRVSPAYNEFICTKLKGIMRERERTKISSATWYMGAILIVFLIFPKEVGMLTLFYVAVGDTVAGIIGVYFGSHRLGQHASLEGSAACFFACFAGTFVLTGYYLPNFELGGMALILFSVLGGIIATVAESSFKKLDDNLVIPLISAPALTLLIKIFS